MMFMIRSISGRACLTLFEIAGLTELRRARGATIRVAGADRSRAFPLAANKGRLENYRGKACRFRRWKLAEIRT